MTKETSQMMKGVAILLMIFLHLFNQSANVDLCRNLIVIDGTPLVSILSRAANPVAFFLILGGYGLYKVYEKGDKHRWSRLLKLMIHYWVILVIFVTIGHLIYPSRYPGSLLAFISNVTGYETSYNGEMWFLLPYVILSASAPWLFRLLRRFKALPIIAVALAIHLCTSFCISRFGVSFLYHNYWAYNPLLVFHLTFSFLLGAMAARCGFFESFAAWANGLKYRRLILWGGVILLVSVSCVFKYNYFYAFGVISCLSIAYMPRPIKKILCALGDQSMNMWMIHSWFCYYLFHDFIYSFSYPVLIFAILVALSYLSSLVINLITRPIERLVMSRRVIASKPIL